MTEYDFAGHDAPEESAFSQVTGAEGQAMGEPALPAEEQPPAAESPAAEPGPQGQTPPALSATDFADDARFLADPQRGELYRSMRPTVLATVEYARRTGTPVEVEDAFRAALAETFFRPSSAPEGETAPEGEAGLLDGRDIFAPPAQTDAFSTPDARFAANRAASPGPLAGPGAIPGTDYAAMSEGDFSRLVHRALRGELRRG